MNVDTFAPGTFCWNELAAADAPRAKSFYTSLFGWSAVDNAIPGDGVYTMLKKGERDVCALAAKRDDQPTAWSSFISVEDVDDTAALVAEAGGTLVSAPFDVMQSNFETPGRMCVIKDNAGAVLSLWQANKHKGAGVVGEGASVVWNELATNDPRGAASFYARVFGWVADVIAVRPPSSSPTTYTTFYAPAARVDDKGEKKALKVAGVIGMNEAWAGIPPHWSTYFGADHAGAVGRDVDAIAKSAGALGGKILVPPFDAPGVGRLTTLADPGGAVFSVIRFA